MTITHRILSTAGLQYLLQRTKNNARVSNWTGRTTVAPSASMPGRTLSRRSLLTVTCNQAMLKHEWRWHRGYPSTSNRSNSIPRVYRLCGIWSPQKQAGVGNTVSKCEGNWHFLPWVPELSCPSPLHCLWELHSDSSSHLSVWNEGAGAVGFSADWERAEPSIISDTSPGRFLPGDKLFMRVSRW